MFKSCGSQSAVSKPAASASPQDLLKIEILRPQSSQPNQKLWGRAQQSILISPPGDSDAQLSLRATDYKVCKALWNWSSQWFLLETWNTSFLSPLYIWGHWGGKEMQLPKCNSRSVGFVGQSTFCEYGVSPTMFSWCPVRPPTHPEIKKSFTTSTLSIHRLRDKPVNRYSKWMSCVTLTDIEKGILRPSHLTWARKIICVQIDFWSIRNICCSHKNKNSADTWNSQVFLK